MCDPYALSAALSLPGCGGNQLQIAIHTEAVACLNRHRLQLHLRIARNCFWDSSHKLLSLLMSLPLAAR